MSEKREKGEKEKSRLSGFQGDYFAFTVSCWVLVVESAFTAVVSVVVADSCVLVLEPHENAIAITTTTIIKPNLFFIVYKFGLYQKKIVG